MEGSPVRAGKRPETGGIPIRFPKVAPADDRGWHIDATALKPDGGWGVSGRTQAMLMLVLLSEVGPDDAPTRIRVGSQRDVATVLDEGVVDVHVAGPAGRLRRGRPG